MLKKFKFSYWILKYEHDLKETIDEYNDICITLMSSHLYDKFYNKYPEIKETKNYSFSRVIFDHADSINIHNCKEINATFFGF